MPGIPRHMCFLHLARISVYHEIAPNKMLSRSPCHLQISLSNNPAETVEGNIWGRGGKVSYQND